MFTRKEEEYLLDSVEHIRKTIDLNNVMLRQIVNIINLHISHSDLENINDFGMNVLANLISNNVDFKKIFKR